DLVADRHGDMTGFDHYVPPKSEAPARWSWSRSSSSRLRIRAEGVMGNDSTNSTYAGTLNRASRPVEQNAAHAEACSVPAGGTGSQPSRVMATGGSHSARVTIRPPTIRQASSLYRS